MPRASRVMTAAATIALLAGTTAPAQAAKVPGPPPELAAARAFTVFHAPAKKKTTTTTTGTPSWSNPNLQPPLSPQTQIAMDFMLSKVGVVPYQYGGTGDPGYDCSGLVQAAWLAAGISLPRTSATQFTATARVPLDQLLPGDLLFFGLDGITHVAMYLGGTKLVEAANPTSGIQVSDMTYTWYRTNLYAAGRVSIGS